MVAASSVQKTSVINSPVTGQVYALRTAAGGAARSPGAGRLPGVWEDAFHTAAASSVPRMAARGALFFQRSTVEPTAEVSAAMSRAARKVHRQAAFAMVMVGKSVAPIRAVKKMHRQVASASGTAGERGAPIRAATQLQP